MWGNHEKMAIYKPGSGSSPAPRSGALNWTSRLQNREKETQCKPPCVVTHIITWARLSHSLPQSRCSAALLWVAGAQHGFSVIQHWVKLWTSTPPFGPDNNSLWEKFYCPWLCGWEGDIMTLESVSSRVIYSWWIRVKSQAHLTQSQLVSLPMQTGTNACAGQGTVQLLWCQPVSNAQRGRHQPSSFLPGGGTFLCRTRCLFKASWASPALPLLPRALPEGMFPWWEKRRLSLSSLGGQGSAIPGLKSRVSWCSRTQAPSLLVLASLILASILFCFIVWDGQLTRSPQPVSVPGYHEEGQSRKKKGSVFPRGSIL